MAVLGQGHAEKDGGDGGEHEPVALGRVRRGDAGGIHEPRDGRARAGEGIGREAQRGDAHAGKAGGLAVAADGVEAAAIGRLFEHDPDRGGHSKRDQREVRQADDALALGPERQAGAGEVGQALRDAVARDGASVRDHEGHAAEDGEGGKCRDEGQDADEADEYAVDETTREAGQEGGGEGERRGPAQGEERGRDDAGKRGHGADREVEVAHRHDHGHGRGDDEQHRDLLADVEPVLRRHEGLRQERREGEDDGGHADEAAMAAQEGSHAADP